jgi:hypothetical protein
MKCTTSLALPHLLVFIGIITAVAANERPKLQLYITSAEFDKTFGNNIGDLACLGSCDYYGRGWITSLAGPDRTFAQLSPGQTVNSPRGMDHKAAFNTCLDFGVHIAPADFVCEFCIKGGLLPEQCLSFGEYQFEYTHQGTAIDWYQDWPGYLLMQPEWSCPKASPYVVVVRVV